MELKEITSADNELIKALKKLGQKKYRQEQGRFLVENYAIIHDALVSEFDCESLFITEDFAKKHPDRVAFLIEKSSAKTKCLISDKLNKIFSELDTPSGIAAVYAQKQHTLSLTHNAVYLNGVSDPGNVGTIMRTALAFGFKNIILDNTCADVYNTKTIGAAKDSIFKLNILFDKDYAWLKANKVNYHIVAANSNDGEPLGSVQTEKNICLVLGSESHGLGVDILPLVDTNIKLKISNEIESLNVAVAAAILLSYYSGL